MESPVVKDDKEHGNCGGERCDLPPPPPASWPASGRMFEPGGYGGDINSRTARLQLRGSSPQEAGTAAPALSWSGFDEDFEVHLAGRRNTSFFVRVAGRELAATNGVAVVLHGGGFTGMSWAPAASVMKRDCCVLAPDLRGHGLTFSSTDGDNDGGKRDGVHKDGDFDSDSDGDRGGGQENGCMSLGDLAEDITSLLVEIFTSGLLFQPRLPPRRRRHEDEEQRHEEQGCGSGADDGGSGSSSGNDPAIIRPDTLGAGALQQRDSIGTASHGNSEESSGDCTAVASPGKVASTVTDRSGGSSTDSPVKLLLAGHSLGGSIAVRVAGAATEVKRRCQGAAEIAGIVAVDVVEGTALAALEDMPEILSKIPKSFPSMEEAILWHVKTGAVRNSQSARVVVPSRLKRDQGGEKVLWRTDLRQTKRHWRGWFEGMSKAFLELPLPKLLVVAGMDRLDTELTSAHMQGRFQLKMVYGCGHSVQEDQPKETASAIINFAIRNSIVQSRTSGVTKDGRRAGEEEILRRKLARAREQAKQNRR